MRNINHKELGSGKIRRQFMFECGNTAIKVLRFTIHTGLKLTPFDVRHGRNLRTESTNLVEDGKSYLSDWSELSVSAE